MTGQTFAVLILGAALGARLGAITAGTYLVLRTAKLALAVALLPLITRRIDRRSFAFE